MLPARLPRTASRLADGPCIQSVCDHRRLPGDLKALPATHVLAGHHVIFADHVGTELRKAGAIAIVSASAQLAFLGPDNPGYFVVRGLMTVRTVQRGRLLFYFLIKKIALFHKIRAPQVRRKDRLLHIATTGS